MSFIIDDTKVRKITDSDNNITIFPDIDDYILEAWRLSVENSLDKIDSSIIILTGTSPGTTNTSTTIELDENASSVNGAYDPAIINITAGTGKGQSRQIFDYVGATKTAIINRDWKVTPDSTSEYTILYNAGDTHVNEGNAAGGGASTITLNSLASDQNNVYLGQMIFITAGTGADQARLCIGYNGTTKVLTVDSPWIVQPDTTSVYAMYPFPGFIHGAPAINSAANILIRDVIGNKSDTTSGNSIVSQNKTIIDVLGTKSDLVSVPFSPGISSALALLYTGYFHIHGASFVYPDKADPVTLTSSVASWSETGDITEVIPADTITKNFDLHWCSVNEISATLYGMVDIFAGASGQEEKIGAIDVSRTTNQAREDNMPVQIPQQPANTRISCRFSDSTSSSRTVKIKFYGHVYSGSLT